MKNKTIVITGGAGFIGSNLARDLSKDNQVSVVDNLSTGRLENIQDLIENQQINFIKGSITDLDLLQQTFNEIDYVFHQAAIPSVPRSVNDPLSSHHANVTGTLNVFLAARDNQIKKVVYASSSSVYGDTPTLPKKEDMNPSPLSPYAVGKLTGEYYAQVFSTVYDLPVASLRYFNVYGPGQDPLSEYAAVIPKFITLMLNNKPPIVFGDGAQTRDFTFIKDVIQANKKAAECKATGVFNIACGTRISINDLVSLLSDETQKHTKPIFEDPRPGDILHSLADISKAKQQLNYQPHYSMKQGLQETVQWFQQ